VDGGALVALGCSAQTLHALAEGLTRFGPADGEPEWLVSGVWLCCGDASYLATPSVEVLADGFVSRSMNVERADEFTANTRAALPDVSARLVARGNGFDLSQTDEPITPPETLRSWTARPYSTNVLIRASDCRSVIHLTACALLFAAGGSSLLVGSDPSTLAMVISDEPRLIDRYRADCEELSVPEYLSRLGG
jgi:hypothetical protein